MSLPPRIAALAACLITTGVAVVGCGIGSPHWSDLERDATGDDVLPAFVTGPTDIDESSVRFIGVHEGTRVWLARDESGLCLVQAVGENEDDWSMGCGGGSEEFGMEGPGGSFVALPDDRNPPDGAVQISENVYATD